jgi:hypothetical protein
MNAPTPNTPHNLQAIPQDTVVLLVSATINHNGQTLETEPTGIVIPVSLLRNGELSEVEHSLAMLQVRKHISGVYHATTRNSPPTS